MEGAKETLQDDGFICSLIVVMVSQVYTNVKTYQIV